MTFSFADGTRIEVPASALEDFLEHDLKWVEFVHGRAKKSFLPAAPARVSADPQNNNVHRCLARAC